MQQILVKKNESGIAPKWTSIANFDIPFELAQEVGRLLMNDEQLEFVERSAEMILRMKRETYFKLQWHSNKWIVESSEEFNKVYIWTFSGDKINRTLAKLISIKIGRETRHDYMKIDIDLGKNDSKLFKDVYQLTEEIRSVTIAYLENLLVGNIDVKWFSKFSACLPATLSKKTILEKSMDVEGLVREIKNVYIDKCNQ